MFAKRCGLVSLLLNTKGPTPSLTKLLSFAVNGEFYFTGQFSGLLGGLSPNHWPLKWPPVCNEKNKSQKVF